LLTPNMTSKSYLFSLSKKIYKLTLLQLLITTISHLLLITFMLP